MVARSRFELLSPGFFSLSLRDPEPGIPSPQPWRLATRFGTQLFVGFDRANTSYIKSAIRSDILTLSIDFPSDKTVFKLGLLPHVGNETVMYGVHILASDN